MSRAAIVSLLEPFGEIEFAYLFGSRAAGKARPDSDWDVGVYLDEKLSAGERAEVHRRIAAGIPIGLDVDLVILNDAPPLLGHRALAGEALFIRDRDLFGRVFVRVVGESLDQAWWRDMHRRARLKRIEEGRFGRS